MQRLLAIFLFCFTALGASPTLYVSKDGDNTTGLDWAHAKNELDQIVWGHNAGDILQIDGGVTGMVYSTVMTPNSRGAAGNPVVIKRSTEVGHDGPVYFTPTATGKTIYWNPASDLHDILLDGGATNLFFVDGAGYTGTSQGIIGELSVIRGLYNIEWKNFTVRNWFYGGVYMRSYSNGMFLHDLDVYGCGTNAGTSAHNLRFSTESTASWHGCILSNVYIHDPVAINDNLENPVGFHVKQCVISMGTNTTGSSADGIFIGQGCHDIDIDGNLIVHGSRTNQLIIMSANAGVNVTNIWIHNNIFYSPVPIKDGWGMMIHSRDDTHVTPSTIDGLHVLNNTFFNIGNCAYFRASTSNCVYTNAEFKGNICHIGTNTAGYYMVDMEDNIFGGGPSSTTNIVCDYNYYCSTAGISLNQVIKWLGSAKTLAQVQALGFETHSVYGNPGFVNTAVLPGGLYFDYSAAKPPRYYAPNQSAYFTTDKNGTTRPGVNPWTIGAVECASDLLPLRGHLIPKP